MFTVRSVIPCIYCIRPLVIDSSNVYHYALILYVALMVKAAQTWVLSFLLLPPRKMRRTDTLLVLRNWKPHWVNRVTVPNPTVNLSPLEHQVSQVNPQLVKPFQQSSSRCLVKIFKIFMLCNFYYILSVSLHSFLISLPSNRIHCSKND